MSQVRQRTVEVLYQRYFPVITNKCARMLLDPTEAQDVAQETFARLWSRRDAIEDPRALLAWIYRTSTRIVIDRAREGARLRLADDSEAASLEPTDLVTPEVRAHWRHLMDQVKRLPQRELEVTILSRLDGLTHAEIAVVTGKGERTVRRLLRAADERLQRINQRGKHDR